LENDLVRECLAVPYAYLCLRGYNPQVPLVLPNPNRGISQLQRWFTGYPYFCGVFDA